jgi:hypothetical protein
VRARSGRATLTAPNARSSPKQAQPRLRAAARHQSARTASRNATPEEPGRRRRRGAPHQVQHAALAAHATTFAATAQPLAPLRARQRRTAIADDFVPPPSAVEQPASTVRAACTPQHVVAVEPNTPSVRARHTPHRQRRWRAWAAHLGSWSTSQLQVRADAGPEAAATAKRACLSLGEQRALHNTHGRPAEMQPPIFTDLRRSASANAAANVRQTATAPARRLRQLVGAPRR